MNKYVLKTKQEHINKLINMLQNKFNCRFKLIINEYDFEFMYEYSKDNIHLIDNDKFLDESFKILESVLDEEDLWHVATTCDICKSEFDY